MRRLLHACVLVSIIPVVLIACGSGGGGQQPSSPAATVLSLTPTAIKTFSFSWDDVSGETEYRLLENSDGSSGYTEVASIAADATSVNFEVFLPGRINASYILQSCNSVGCSDSSAVFVSGSLAEAVGYFKASNTDSGDRFGANGESGNATGIGGDQSINDTLESGAVYLY